MLRKCARFAVAVMLAVSLCPMAAYADDSRQSGGSGNPLADLLYMVVGYESADESASASSDANLYPNELVAPPASTALPDLVNATDNVNGGLLIGASGDLYYLREATFSAAGAENVYAYRTFEKYNMESGSWTTLESLPSWLEYCSATLFDGVIVVSGAVMASQDGIPSHSDSPEQRVYTYDPASETPGWSEFSSDGVPAGSAIVNSGGTLKVVGGIAGGSPSATISEYESSTGLGEAVGSLAFGAIAPKVVPHNGALYVYSFGSSVQEAQTGSGAPYLQLFDGGASTDISSGLPLLDDYSGTSSLSAEADSGSSAGAQSVRAAQYGGLSSSVEGLVIAAPASDGNLADTYVMSWSDSVFASYDQRACGSALFGTASCVYLGKLYALGSYIDETGASKLAFRSTPMADATLLMGNNGVWRQGSDQALPFVYSPDFGRFAYKVVIDGQELSMGRDYSSYAGDDGAVVSVLPELLSQLSLGKHSLSAYFDDGFTEIAASFTVETEATSIAEGYTRPASLAMTSDNIPVVPIAALGLMATCALAIFYGRRASRF